MAVDQALKKNIRADWQGAFPALGWYAPTKLYQVVGPVVMGLELIRLPRSEDYRPHFVVYPLWRQDVTACLSFPFVLKEYYNAKGLQFNIPYQRHRGFFEEVVAAMKQQTPLWLDGSITGKKAAAFLDAYARCPPLSFAPDSYLQATLQEAKLKIALFTGPAEAEAVIEHIQQRSWNDQHFKACGIDKTTWLRGLRDTVSNREPFLQQIEANKQNSKIAQLPSADLSGNY